MCKKNFSTPGRKCFNTQRIYYQRAPKTFWQPLTTSHYLTNCLTQQSKLKWLLKKNFFTKNFLCLLKIIIRSSLLYFRPYVYAQELFTVSWNNLHTMEHFFYSFTTGHYIRLLLNPLCNSSMCYQLLVLSIRSQHNLVIDSL